MTEKHGKLRVPSDDDGCIARRCPCCSEVFRVVATDREACEDDRLYCPCCGMANDWGLYLPSEVIEEAQVRMKNMAIDILNEAFKDMGRKFSKGPVTFKPGKPISHEPEADVHDPYIDVVPISTSCCSRLIHVPAPFAEAGIYCPFCGVK